MRRNPVHRAITLSLALTCLFGCSNQARVARENDRLRAEALELGDSISRLELRNAELESALMHAATISENVPADVLASTPRLARISIGRLSHARDTNDDGVADELRIYILPEDGRARFLQITGTLSVHAALLPDSADATTIGRVTLGPGELHDAYRSGFTGTSYAVVFPIDAAGETSLEAQVDVRAIFIDGVTGMKYEAHRAISLTDHAPSRSAPAQ